MPNNEINVNIKVDERKGAVAPLTAATDTFQPIETDEYVTQIPTDGSGISYTLGQTITPTTDRTLYAIWQEITYDITYVYNYGTGTPDYVDTITYTEAQSYVMNTAVECSFVPPSGYELSTWNTAANGSGTNYAVGSTHTITANLTIYAQWVTI